MEYIVDMRITAVAFDEGGAFWKGKKKAMTLLNHSWRMLRL